MRKAAFKGNLNFMINNLLVLLLLLLLLLLILLHKRDDLFVHLNYSLKPPGLASMSVKNELSYIFC